MACELTDQEIVNDIIQKLGTTPQSTVFDDEDHLTDLALYGFDLPQFPDEICHLAHLRLLDIRCNQLTSLPNEIGLVTNLQVLLLNHNQLSSLPPKLVS